MACFQVVLRFPKSVLLSLDPAGRAGVLRVQLDRELEWRWLS